MKKLPRCLLLKKKLKGHPQILTTSIALNLLRKIMLKSQKHSSSIDWRMKEFRLKRFWQKTALSSIKLRLNKKCRSNKRKNMMTGRFQQLVVEGEEKETNQRKKMRPKFWIVLCGKWQALINQLLQLLRKIRKGKVRKKIMANMVNTEIKTRLVPIPKEISSSKIKSKVTNSSTKNQLPNLNQRKDK